MFLRVPARLPPWAVFHLAQMCSIPKLLLESFDDIFHDGHTCERQDTHE